MDDEKAKVSEILRRAEETLKTARHGLDDLLGENRERRFSGLRNLIVFGRSFTWVLQNLRSVLEERFEAWYVPEQEAMSKDPLMRYFVDARNELEKQGKLSVSSNGTIKSSNLGKDLRKFGTPPVGAKGFFIGDQFGGTGWDVELANGVTVKYYVVLPSSMGSVTQHFSNFPAAKAPELAKKSIEDLSGAYLDKLDALLDRARNQFLKEPPRQPHGNRRLPSYIRVVK